MTEASSLDSSRILSPKTKNTSVSPPSGVGKDASTLGISTVLFHKLTAERSRKYKPMLFAVGVYFARCESRPLAGRRQKA